MLMTIRANYRSSVKDYDRGTVYVAHTTPSGFVLRCCELSDDVNGVLDTLMTLENSIEALTPEFAKASAQLHKQGSIDLLGRVGALVESRNGMLASFEGVEMDILAINEEEGRYD